MMREPTEIKTLIRDSFIIILIAAGIGFAVNLFHPHGYVMTAKDDLQNTAIVYISSEEAKIKIDTNAAICIDAREKGDFQDGRIRGAINIPAHPGSLAEKMLTENRRLLSEPKELVLYCSGAACPLAESLAKRIIGLGYNRHLYIIKEGLPEWEKQMFPIDRGPAANREDDRNE